MNREAKGCLRAFGGLVLIPIVHIPRLLFFALQASYAWVFNAWTGLTADPREHLSRARRQLKQGDSHLLYAAIELRFALERMAQQEIAFVEQISQRVLDDNDPVKKLKALHRTFDASKFPHRIVFVNRATGERFDWGQYKPLDLAKVTELQGRLGNILHPKNGLMLGVRHDQWYTDTRTFLADTEQYLAAILMGNRPFATYAENPRFEIERADLGSVEA